MVRTLVLVFILVTSLLHAAAQELQARVTVNASLVSSQVDKKVFQTLQNSITNFLNNRKWTKEVFQPAERISCNFLLTIRQSVGENVYKASLVVQASRPVFNSSYQSPLINFQDETFTFKYVEFQPVDFNDNRVSSSDPLASNLSATLAYYAYIILGLDFGSFSLRGGDPYFQKAQQIVNNAPEGRDIEGWRPFDGQRNRYWLMENLTNNRYALVHDAIYNYYRLGMDMMYENPSEGRSAIMNCLNQLNTLNADISNSMIVPFFFQGRSGEIIKLFKKGEGDEKTRAREILVRLDVTNANTYKQELK